MNLVEKIASEFLDFNVVSDSMIDDVIYASVGLQRVKSAAVERGKAFSLLEWLDFWFSEGLADRNIQTTGVFFTDGSRELDTLKSYVDNYKSLKIDEPLKHLQYVAERVDDLNKAVESNDRKKVQDFVDEFAAQYTFDENGNFLKDKDGKIIYNDKYNTGNKNISKKNKELIDKYNQGLIKSRGDVIKTIIKTIKDSIEDQAEYLKVSNPGESQQSTVDISQAKVSHDIFSGIENLITVFEYSADVSEKQLRGSDFDIKTLTKEKKELTKKLTKLQEANKDLSNEKYQIDNLYAELSNNIKEDEIRLEKLDDTKASIENIEARQQAGEEINQEELQYLQYYHQIVDDIDTIQKRIQNNEARKKELITKSDDKQYDSVYILNKNKIDTITDRITDINEKLHNYSESSTTNQVSEKKLKYFRRQLDITKENLEKYKKAYQLLTQSNIDSLDEEDFNKLLTNVNELLRPRDQFSPATVLRDVGTEDTIETHNLIYSEGTEDKNLQPTSEIVKIRDEFIKALSEDYTQEQKKIIDAHQIVSNLIENNFKSLYEAYKNAGESIQSSLQRLVSSPETLKSIIDDTNNITEKIKRFENRKNLLQEFRTSLSKYKGADAHNIESLANPGSDKTFERVVRHVAKAINVLHNYSIALDNNPEMYEDLKRYDISKADISDAMDELRKVGVSADGNLKGTNKIVELLNKLQSVKGTDVFKILPRRESSSNERNINELRKELTKIDTQLKKIKEWSRVETNKERLRIYEDEFKNLTESKNAIRDQIMYAQNKDKTIQDKKHDLKSFLIIPLKEAASDIGTKVSDDTLDAVISGITIFSNAIKDVVSHNFIDIGRINDIIRDARKVKGLEHIFDDRHVIAYINSIKENSNSMDIRTHSIVKDEIIKVLKELRKEIKSITDSIKEHRALILRLLYGDYGSLSEMKIHKNEIMGNLERLNSMMGDTEDDPEIRETRESTKNKYEKELQKINEQIQESSSANPELLEMEKIIGKALYPQKVQVVQILGDREAVSTIDKELAPSQVKESSRNWYSSIRMFDSLVKQCLGSIRGALSSGSHEYAVKETQYSPKDKSIIESPIQQELSSISEDLKNTTDPEQKKELSTNYNNLVLIKEKIKRKPAEVVQGALDQLKNTPPPKRSKDYKKEVYYLNTLLHRLDVSPNALTQYERNDINKLRFTPAEHKVINAIKEKWESQLTSGDVGVVGMTDEVINRYTDILTTTIQAYSSEMSPLFEKLRSSTLQPEEKELLTVLSNKRKSLWQTLFKAKYAPRELNDSDISIIRKLDKEVQKRKRLNPF